MHTAGSDYDTRCLFVCIMCTINCKANTHTNCSNIWMRYIEHFGIKWQQLKVSGGFIHSVNGINTAQNNINLKTF